jgi:hypothetical protein
MLRLSSSLVAICLGLTGLVLACSSSSSPAAASTPCNEAPFSCPTGQTCWVNTAGSAFECLDSAAGVSAGASCVDTGGKPTCGDAQLCYQGLSSTSGVCVSYCDPTSAAHGCPSGYSCGELEIEANATLTTYVCVPPATEDAGTEDSSTSSPDSSSATDSSTAADTSTDAPTAD